MERSDRTPDPGSRKCGGIDPKTDEAQLAFDLYAPLEFATYLSTLRDPGMIDLGRRAIRGTIARARPAKTS